MLIIRNEQMQVFDDLIEDEFVEKMTLLLREQDAETVDDLSDEELKRRVRVGFRRARRHELLFEDSLIAFVRLMFTVAPNFDEQTNIKRMLGAEEVDPDDRLEVVFDIASDEDWAEAQSLYDETAWEETSESREDGAENND